MSRKSAPPPDLPELDSAMDQALKAAAAATDAAHEAEAVLAARTDAAQATARTARRMGWLAAVTGAAALVMALIAGGALWRASASLSNAAEIQAAATAALVERVTELNGALDRMDETVARAEVLTDRLDRPAPVAAPVSTAPAATPDDATIERLRIDILAAIAAAERALLDRLAQNPPAPPPAPAPAASASAAAPATRQSEARRPAAARPNARPAARATPRPAEPNPFRFP
ncbi:hypothetical protein [Paracoccus sp. NSM]|uniref:hypothetical protein n=1 Tax=Paracoccus sp. NSM TaxID=3457784 RepID=UPI0040353163